MIAIDAMGGDFAPDVVVQGSLRCAKNKKIQIALFGVESIINEKLEKLDVDWVRHPISIFDTSQVIEMGEDPVRSVRKKTDSSLVRSVMSVVNGECSAVVSAGNSGALMVAALFLIGREPGVERVPIAGLLPGKEKPVVALDLGANADCKAHHLLQFAHLGIKAFPQLFGNENPRVGLLSNGSEVTKGSLLTKEVFVLLEKSGLNFVGNVEPNDIVNNNVDIVVTDGFSGNILLKSFEATAELCGKSWSDMLVDVLERKDALRGVGGILLGINKPAIVVHGNADARDIERAIVFALSVTSFK